MAFANTSRRTFRGRNGPTDGNIPHALSRRSRTARQEAREQSNTLALNRRRAREQQQANGSSTSNGATTSDASDAEAPADDGVDANSVSDELRKETSHLKRRVRNVRESIQLSQAIVNPTTWERNCLNAVSNCVDEWKSNLSVHFHYNQSNAENEEISDTIVISTEILDIVREASLSVFGLVQMALQSGPLTGPNPGYFKRCGGEVARRALKFLKSDAFAGDLAQTLLFTEKQIAAIQKWTKNAEKAVEGNKPPSISAAKLQQGKGKSRAKKEKAANKRPR